MDIIIKNVSTIASSFFELVKLSKCPKMTTVYQIVQFKINILEQMCSTGRNGEGNLAQNTKLGKYTVKGYKLSFILIPLKDHTEWTILYGSKLMGHEKLRKL